MRRRKEDAKDGRSMAQSAGKKNSPGRGELDSGRRTGRLRTDKKLDTVIVRIRAGKTATKKSIESILSSNCSQKDKEG
jgi:hypothetical protein